MDADSGLAFLNKASKDLHHIPFQLDNNKLKHNLFNIVNSF